MSYADLVNQSPKANRTSTDRLILPPRPPSRGSLTPEPKRSVSRVRYSLIPTSPIHRQSSERFKLNRNTSISQKLFQTNSQEIFGGPRRQSSCGSDISVPNSPTVNKRILPSKPSHEIQFSDIPSDFYISPMDWSKHDMIAFALSTKMVFINPKTEEVTVPQAPYEVTSVKYDQSGELLAFGCDDGHLEIFDVPTLRPKSSYDIFDSTILVSDWNENTIVSGGRDGMISLIDTRCSPHDLSIYNNIHLEEICCVKFNNKNPNILATSSNDSTVKLWDIRFLEEPTIVFSEHTAAVRAVQFSPTTTNIIASGGGTSDKTIRLWNYTTGETVSVINTGSQVCNMFWNEEYNEI
ncbi:WD repeat protein [Tritrichomonas foetus]|uniref:WD repeat protein n=1 Tax=Tritrichomonas foetus TaxID=1144522 RepID=A0A1J4KQD0_9EUKA|nr:WD repeat protein [Tritrichomonas foetus]|eukprot:OHT13314.1 WD repeat protein [Tritrichomonas foetus]